MAVFDRACAGYWGHLGTGLAFCLAGGWVDERQKARPDPNGPAVIAACMHKLLRQIYGVLKSRNAFDPQFLGNRLDFQDGI